MCTKFVMIFVFYEDNINMRKSKKQNKMSKSNKNVDKDIDKNIEYDNLIEIDEIDEIEGGDVSYSILKLGDVIQIKGIIKDEIDEKDYYLVEYLTSEKMKVINVRTKELLEFSISDDGIIDNGKISDIIVLSSNKENGYARQHKLLPPKNIIITLNDGTELRGEITNIEEDMITVNVKGQGEIYIDFSYTGIPEDMPIKSIKIVDDALNNDEKEEEKEEENDEEDEENDEEEEMVDVDNSKKEIDEDFLDLDVDNGEVIEFEAEKQVGKNYYKYDMETQTQKLLETLMGKIPITKRLNLSLVNKVKQEVNAYVILKYKSAVLDDDGTYIRSIVRTAKYRPMSEYILSHKNKLPWLMLTGTNVKKIYRDDDDMEIRNMDNIMNDGYMIKKTSDTVNNIINIQREYNKGNVGSTGESSMYGLVSMLQKVNVESNSFLVANMEEEEKIKKGIISVFGVNEAMNVMINNNVEYGEGEYVLDVLNENNVRPDVVENGRKNVEKANKNIVKEEENDIENVDDEESKEGYIGENEEIEELEEREEREQEGGGEIDFVVPEKSNELYSIVFGSKKFNDSIHTMTHIYNRRLNMEKYIDGDSKQYIEDYRRQIQIITEVTKPDYLYVNGLITMPEPVVRYSQAVMPMSSILTKSNLASTPVEYWKIFKRTKPIMEITINNIDGDDVDMINYDENTFVNDLKFYKMNMEGKEVGDETLHKFLDVVFPKIRILFRYVKKYITGSLSFVELVRYMEPFMVYSEDLTFLQFKEMKAFILKKIYEHNKIFKENERQYLRIAYYNRHISQQNKEIKEGNEDILRILDLDTIDKYKLLDENKRVVSGTELLNKMMNIDGGNLLNMSVLKNSHLSLYPVNVDELIKYVDDNKKMQGDNQSMMDECKTILVSKKYYSIEDLKSDNDKKIYYDKEYDTTDYSILLDYYSREMNILKPDELRLFLKSEMMKKGNKTKKPPIKDENEAIKYVNALINQAKEVEDGDYAVLVISKENIEENSAVFNEYKNVFSNSEESKLDTNKLIYFIRQNGVWMHKNINGKASSFTDDETELCNVQKMCVYVPQLSGEEINKCMSDEDVAKHMRMEMINSIRKQFDNNYAKTKEEYIDKVNRMYEKVLNELPAIIDEKNKKILKYNNYLYKLGLSMVNVNDKPLISPYARLLNLILGQQDFLTKQDDIIKFANKYCREGDPLMANVNDGKMENKWWMYCLETNVKLMPLFRLKIAESVIVNDNYQETIRDLISDIGVLGNGGDAWVDMNSGEIIVNIEFDTDEGFTDAGFAKESRAVIEDDDKDKKITTTVNGELKILNEDEMMIVRIINIMSKVIGVDMDKNIDFIMKHVMHLLHSGRVIASKSVYEKRAREMPNKMPEYKLVFMNALLFLVISMFIVMMQSSIPSMRPMASMPECKKSLDGYPLFGGENDCDRLTQSEAETQVERACVMRYMTCVLNKIRKKNSTIMPWSLLPKEDLKDTMFLRIKKHLSYVLTIPEVESKLEKKRIYLSTNIENEISSEYDVRKWKTFLPPMGRNNIDLTKIESITDEFKDMMKSSIRMGGYNSGMMGGDVNISRNVGSYRLVLSSKIMIFSLAMLQRIQKIIDPMEFLLKANNKYYVENACCNDDVNNSTLEYFVKHDKNIDMYVNQMKKMSEYLEMIKRLTRSTIFLSSINTKRVIPKYVHVTSEQTIYLGFINFCNMQTTVGLPKDLRMLCGNKVPRLQITDTLQEKIEKLKRDGHMYTVDEFNKLIQLVGKHGIVQSGEIKKEMNVMENTVKMINGMEMIKNTDNDTKEFISKFKMILNMDLSDEKMIKQNGRMFKDYIMMEIKMKSESLISFISKYNQEGSKSMLNMRQILLEFGEWRMNENKNRMVEYKIMNESLLNISRFYGNYIYYMALMFPSMILNGREVRYSAPSYWGFGLSHTSMLSRKIKEYYEGLSMSMNNESVNKLLKDMLENGRMRDIVYLSDNMPIMSEGGKNKLNMLFDEKLTILMYKYYMLSVMTQYMKMSYDARYVSSSLNSDELKKNICSILLRYANMMKSDMNVVNVSYDDVMDKVFKLKEAEKIQILKKFRKSTQEEKNHERRMQQFKLGKYSVGMKVQKYSEEMYEFDKETMANIEEELRTVLAMDEMLDEDGASDENKIIENDAKRRKKMEMKGYDINDVEAYDKMIEEDGMYDENDVYAINGKDSYSDENPFGEDRDGETDYY